MGMHPHLRLHVRWSRRGRWGRGKERVGGRCGDHRGGGDVLCGVNRRFLLV
jgi:hypothetical protein